MASPKWLDLRLTIGSVIQISLIVLGGAGVWFSLVNSVNNNTRQIETNDIQRKAEIAANLAQINAIRVDQIATDKAQQAQQLSLTKNLAEMGSDIKWLRYAFSDMRRGEIGTSLNYPTNKGN